MLLTFLKGSLPITPSFPTILPPCFLTFKAQVLFNAPIVFVLSVFLPCSAGLLGLIDVQYCQIDHQRITMQRQTHISRRSLCKPA